MVSRNCLQLKPDEAVKVILDKQANVRFLDELNFNNYKNGKKHTYFGGQAKSSPIHIKPPSSGHWHLVIDLGGYPGSVRASVNTVGG